MKEIRAYIHNHRIADVIRALKESGQCNGGGTPGCRNLNMMPVQSLLKAVDAKEQHYRSIWPKRSSTNRSWN